MARISRPARAGARAEQLPLFGPQLLHPGGHLPHPGQQLVGFRGRPGPRPSGAGPGEAADLVGGPQPAAVDIVPASGAGAWPRDT